MAKKKILFIYPNFSTFVEKDFLYLQEKADVIPFRFKPEKNIFKFIKVFIKQFFFLMKNIKNTDILFCWFADYHSFLPVVSARLFNKKSVIIVGGTDAVSVPEFKYGIFYKRNLRSILVKYIYSNASFIFAVNKSLIQGINYYADKKGLATGVKSFVKKIKGKIAEVPTGYDSDLWYFDSSETKERSIVTVASVKDMRTFNIKGLPMFIEVARILDSYKFIIIGLSNEMKDFINKQKPMNLVLMDYIENDKLREVISKSKVYAQFSLTEGLPNALCEAMLCECIPVGSNVNGIPDGIGEAGFILKDQNVEEAAKLISEAINSNTDIGKNAREHIINNFSHEKRENTIYKLLEI